MSVSLPGHLWEEPRAGREGFREQQEAHRDSGAEAIGRGPDRGLEVDLAH